jgi:hypothetical protein
MDNNYKYKESSTLLIKKQLNKGIEVNDCLLPYFFNNDS